MRLNGRSDGTGIAWLGRDGVHLGFICSPEAGRGVYVITNLFLSVCYTESDIQLLQGCRLYGGSGTRQSGKKHRVTATSYGRHNYQYCALKRETCEASRGLPAICIYIKKCRQNSVAQSDCPAVALTAATEISIEPRRANNTPQNRTALRFLVSALAMSDPR